MRELVLLSLFTLANAQYEMQGDGNEPLEAMLASAGFVVILFLFIWMSNRLHDKKEKDKQQHRERERAKYRKREPDPVVVPKIVPARPRHPKIESEPALPAR
eukprot:TRINITY_DN36110_c0_g1_i1.p1 TRINITY_DN36110_c0_g1~~TRINITY_DN36110_c0_g1_i1.p1  ORF type:complete len:112 (+),score=29.05 TRINITY_DN36110_c0_g1_i1:33-338(+)